MAVSIGSFLLDVSGASLRRAVSDPFAGLRDRERIRATVADAARGLRVADGSLDLRVFPCEMTAGLSVAGD